MRGSTLGNAAELTSLSQAFIGNSHCVLSNNAGPMSSQPPSPACTTDQHSRPVCISYSELQTGNVDSALEEAFGFSGLGIILVRGVPGYQHLRQRFLHLGYQFVALPHSYKCGLEDPASSYSFGWSYGREQLQDGERDVSKESFYYKLGDEVASSATPELSRLALSSPAYYRDNRWPTKELPQFRAVALEAARCVQDVGLLLARQVDRFISSHSHTAGTNRSLEQQIGNSRAHKARLLGYHPQGVAQAGAAAQRAWCTEHTDHSTLTGLVPAMYFDQRSGEPVACPDQNAGLYVRRQDGSHIQVSIPQDCMAFQTGEAAQVASGDLLHATPHYVQAACGPAAEGVVRVTLAVFLQPDVHEALEPPPGMHTTVCGWRSGMLFGEFADNRFAAYYPDLRSV